MLNNITAQAQKNVAMTRSQISSGIWLMDGGIIGRHSGVMEGISIAKVSMSCQRFWRLDLDPLAGWVVGVVILGVVTVGWCCSADSAVFLTWVGDFELVELV